MSPPFRAEHVGSFLRPADLLELRAKSPQDLHDLEDSSIKNLVQKQLELNIRPITDGEFRRHIFYGNFFENIAGFELKDVPIPEGYRTDFPTATGYAAMGLKTRTAAVCTGKIEWLESPYMPEWEYLRPLLESVGGKELWKEAKITIPSLTWNHMPLAPGTAYLASSGYKSDESYFEDLAAAYRQELKTLYDAGLRNIQIDDPNLTYFCSQQFLEGCRKDGVEPDKLLELYIWAHNLCLRDRPRDLHVGVHLCRGNFTGTSGFASGSYEMIAEKLFTRLVHDTFYLEFDSDRAGNFAPLRHLPKGKNVVLGLVSTKTPELEDPKLVEERVREAAKVVGEAQGVSEDEALGCLSLSPQCGFSSAAQGGGKGVTEEAQWKKMELVRDVARKVWRDAI